ncbi:MAG: Ig-like domain-containing protein [Gemmatimonadota bacterium]|nr:Ig-like domain-containing protein [Gemmatimonadota bacterium]
MVSMSVVRAPGALSGWAAVLALGLAAACGGDPAPVDPPDPPRAVAISISPASASFSSIGDTQTFTARLTDQYGAEFNGTVTWASDNPDVFTVDAAGLVTAAGNGTGVVRASYEQLSATAQVTVRQVVVALTVSPALDSLFAIGDTATFTATAEDANGHPVEDTEVTWASDHTDVFTVDPAGLVTAAGNGTGTVRASYEQLSGTARVTVRQVAATVTVSPALHTFFDLGETATFTAGAADANGFEVVDAVATWESSAPLVATVDANGVVTAVGDGEARITATVDGVAGNALVATETVIRIMVARLDTTIAVPIDAGGRNWTYTAEESRWLPEMPVAELTRRASPPGVVAEILGPGSVRIDPTIGGERVRGVLVEVAPPQPFVLSLEQEDWPDTDIVTVRGYAVDRIALPAFRVGGEPALEALGDSVEMRFMPSPLNGGECSGDPVGMGAVEVLGAQVPGPQTVNRLAGPVAVLEPGESFRIGGADSCLRLWAQPGAAYVLAGVERSAIDASRYAPSPASYGGGAPYTIEVTDRTVQPSARRWLIRAEPPHVEDSRHPAPPRLHESMYWAQSDSLEGLDTRTEKWEVGDEFQWYTHEGRSGVFRVVALYPPNVVFAVFKEDMDDIWNATRVAEFDEIMNWLGSKRVQDLYKTVFGPRVPITNTNNEQMVVMYNDGSDDASTGVMIHNIDGERTTTTVHMRAADWGDKGWYHNLAAHELAHAWDRRNLPGFVGPWSSEGIANWFADENSRLATNTPLDANWNVEVPLRGFRLRLPWFGDFVAGYRESHPYLRFLVTRLVFDNGQSYASATRRVIGGAAEDWYGHYFVQWNEWDLRGKGPGLIERMREVVPGWDPFESRLDWMVSFALDDRGGLPKYDIPFVHRAWQYFEPWETISIGAGLATGGQSAEGGNYYFLVNDPGGIGGSVHLEVTEGDARVEWKLVRYR